MRYKLIAIDMDGTLLDSKHRIRETTLSAIKKAVDAGVLVVIATGRSVPGVEIYAEAAQFNGPLISYNGAMITASTQDRTVLYEKPLDSQAAAEVIRHGKQYRPAMCIWSGHQLYTFDFSEKVQYYASFSKSKPIIIDCEDALLRQSITKIMWYDEADKIQRYVRELRTKLREDVTHCTSNPCYLEFFHHGASKGNALRFLSDAYNIPPSAIIAVGDEMNDISMLEFAGCGVAMGNAQNKVKERADFISLSNDEDGLAHVINHFLLR